MASVRTRSAAQLAAVVVACYAALVALFLGIGSRLTEGGAVVDRVRSFDHEVDELLVPVRTSAVGELASSFSVATDPLTVVVLVSALVTWLSVRGRSRLVVRLVVGVVLELAVYVTLALTVDRPRPDDGVEVAFGVLRFDNSFPSGHAAMSVVLYGTFAVIAGRVAPRPLAKVVRVLGVVVPLVVGTSRLVTATHWLSDVAAGYALGAACLIVGSWAAGPRSRHHRHGPSHAPAPPRPGEPTGR